MFNLANNLTLLRILSVPIIVLLMYFPAKITMALAMVIFILASLTDLFDGIIARKYNLVTNVGKFLDPLADKILITSVLIMFVHLGWLPAWMVIVIICREITVTGLRAIAADQGLVIAADKYGKLKTVFQVLALCPLLLHYSWFGFDPVPLGMLFIWCALFMTVFSGINYLLKFSRVWQG